MDLAFRTPESMCLSAREEFGVILAWFWLTMCWCAVGRGMKDKLVRALFHLRARLDLPVWWKMWLGSIIEVIEPQIDK